jgi:hypothetical protein
MSRKIRNSKGEEIEIPDDFNLDELRPVAKAPPKKPSDFRGMPLADFLTNMSGADKILDFAGGFNQGGESAVDLGQIGGSVASNFVPGGPIIKAFLEPVMSYAGGKVAGLGAEALGSNDVPQNQALQAILGSVVGQGLKGGTAAGQEIGAFAKAVKTGDLQKYPSAITKWLSERYLPTFKTPKGDTKGVYENFEPVLQSDTDAAGNVLSESPWLRGEDILKWLKSKKYPILTSQATGSQSAARQEAGNRRLGDIFNAQNLEMRNLAGEISESGLRNTPQTRGLNWEQEVLAALPSVDKKTKAEFKASKLGKTLGTPTGVGKKRFARLKSAEEGIKEAFRANNSADFDRQSRILGKEKTADFLKEEFISQIHDPTTGQFSTEAGRKFLKAHQSKYLKTLSSEERHSINRFMAAMDYHDARRNTLNYVPSLSRGEENSLKSALGIAVTNPLKSGLSQASGRQLSNFAYFGIDKLILNKLVTKPKFAYAAARLTELPAGSNAAKGPLKTILGLVGKAGVTIKLDINGQEIEMAPSEDGQFITPLGGKPAKVDDFFNQ